MPRKAASRVAILEAARRVAARDGARDLSLRGVAAEAGFAPAALYGYFRSKDELLLALAAEDLTQLARAMRGTGGLAGAGAAALDLLRGAETMAAASRGAAGGAAERRCRAAVQWPADRGAEGAVGCQRLAVRQPRKPVRCGAGGGGAGGPGAAGAFGPAGGAGLSRRTK